MPFLVAALLALALQSPGATLAPGGTLRAAFLATNPVQARLDAQTGAASGPVPDLVRELARRHGLRYELIPVPDAATVIERVRGRQVDIGFLAYEAARAMQVDFSEPYALMRNSYLVPAASAIRTSADVNRPGLKVGAVKGQSQQIWVSEHLTAAQLVIYPAMPSNEAVVAMMAKGELDAFAANRQRMQEIAHGSPAVRVLADDFMTIGQAFVVGKGEQAKLELLNRFVREARQSGLVRQSIDKAGLTGSVDVP